MKKNTPNSEQNSKSSYSKSIKLVLIITAIFVALTAVSMLASTMAMRSQKRWVEDENKRIAKENEQLETEHAQQQAQLEQEIESQITKDRPVPNAEGWDVLDLSDYPLEFPEQVTVSRAELYSSGLMLANPWNALPSDYESYIDPLLVSVGKETGGKIQVHDYNVRLLPLATSALQNMISEAATFGHGDYIVRAGFRTQAEQQELFDNIRSKLSSKYSGDTLMLMTKERVNEPGTSEYQTGLSAQISFYNKDNIEISKQAINDNDAGKWLLDNSWQYGYVFRFPIEDYPFAETLDKSNLTGVSIRLSVFRYVGVPAATLMHIKNFVLEEFINYMIEHPHIGIYEDGQLKYEILRTQIAPGFRDSETVDVPVGVREHVSSYDNLGGIISMFTY